MALLLLCACNKDEPASQPPSNPSEGLPSTDAGPPGGELTAAQCEAADGVVVGDIGDGAIHRADYACEGSGQPPIGTIVAEAGEPMGVEGAVCCEG